MIVGSVQYTNNAIITPEASGNVRIGTTSSAIASGVFDNIYANMIYASGVQVHGGGGEGVTGEGTTKYITQEGHGLYAGNVVRLSGSSYIKAKADTSANAEVIGIVSSVADIDHFTLLTEGYISTLSGLTAGTVYFLSDVTAGLLTATEPSTNGRISKPLLIATSATAGMFFNFRGMIVGIGGLGLGAWESKSNNTNYQAEDDGFVLAWSSDSVSGSLDGYTDGTTTPTTQIVNIGWNQGTGSTHHSLTMPVRKDDYWRVEGATTVFWIPSVGSSSGGGGGGEDTISRGFEMVYNSITAVDVNPGVLYHGTNRVGTTATTTLTLATAADWYDGSTHSYSGGAGWCYIGVDNAGSIKLIHTNAPDKTDTAGGTIGDKLYWYYTTGTKYYRVIGAVMVNTSDNIINKWYQNKDRVDFEAVQVVSTSYNGTWSGAVSLSGFMPAISQTGIFCLQSYALNNIPYVGVRPHGSTSGKSYMGSAGYGSGYLRIQAECNTDSSQQVNFYAYGAASPSCSFELEGYYLNIR